MPSPLLERWSINLACWGSVPLTQVVVLAARNLPPRPAAIALGLRDAYCNISFAGARQVTPVVRQSQHPTWNYSALFPLDVQPQGPETSGDGDFETAAAGTSALPGEGGANASSSPPSPLAVRLRPPHLLLRIDMKDVDPLPPDDDLG
jgi:hypothetical protein